MTLWMDAGFLGTLTAAAGFDDPDVNAHIAAVETADGAPLPTEIKDAMNTLITGLKADSQWDNINTLVMVNAAQTIAGTQIAMKGTDPGYTNVVPGDYTRGLGILGSGTKWGNTNVLQSAIGTSTTGFVMGLSADYTNQSAVSNIIGRPSTDPRTSLAVSGSNTISARLRSNTFFNPAGALSASSIFAIGASRESGNLRVRAWYNGTAGVNQVAANTHQTPTAGNILLMVQDETLVSRWNRRLTGYVLGASSDSNASLAAIVARITTYANAVRTHLGV